MAARRSLGVVQSVVAHRSLVEELAEAAAVHPDLQVGTRSRLGRHPGQDFASVEALAQSLVLLLVEEQIHLLCQLLLLLQALPCSTE